LNTDIMTVPFFTPPALVFCAYLCPRNFQMLSKIVLALGLLAGSSAVELTPDNFDEMTAGKTAFIKFLAPW